MHEFKSQSQVITALIAATIFLALPAKAEEACSQSNGNTAGGSFSITNKHFISNYENAKKEIRQNLGPVIIVRGASMKLIKDGKDIETKTFIKSPYTQLKEVAHITLGTYVILVNHAYETDEKELPEKTKAKLTEFKEAIESATPTVKKLDIDETQKEIQKELIAKTGNFIDTVLKNNKVSRKELRDYTRSVAPLTLKNVDGASKSQIDEMDKIARGWAKSMTENELAAIHVVIATNHMPRIKLSSLQYFLKLLKQKRPGQKVIISEGIDTDEKAIDLLLTHMLDENVAVDFYKDEWRMHRDLLSDGIAKYLRKNPPAPLEAGSLSKVE